MTEERARARRGHRKPPSSVAKPRFTAWASSRAFRDASRDARRSSSRSRLSPPPSSPPRTSVEASRNARKRSVTLRYFFPPSFAGLLVAFPFPGLAVAFPARSALTNDHTPVPRRVSVCPTAYRALSNAVLMDQKICAGRDGSWVCASGRIALDRCALVVSPQPLMPFIRHATRRRVDAGRERRDARERAAAAGAHRHGVLGGGDASRRAMRACVGGGASVRESAGALCRAGRGVEGHVTAARVDRARARASSSGFFARRGRPVLNASCPLRREHGVPPPQQQRPSREPQARVPADADRAKKGARDAPSVAAVPARVVASSRRASFIRSLVVDRSDPRAMKITNSPRRPERPRRAPARSSCASSSRARCSGAAATAASRRARRWTRTTASRARARSTASTPRRAARVWRMPSRG